MSKDKQVKDIFEERTGSDGGGGLREKGTEILNP